jgi:hypothetical protein
MAIQLHGLEAKQGETSFAFLVLRLVQPADRAGLVAVIRHLAAMIPDAEGFVAGLPEELDETMRVVGMPWLPPEAGPAVELQRQLIEAAATRGVEAAWFFQTGTALPSVGGDEDDDRNRAPQRRWRRGRRR